MAPPITGAVWLTRSTLKTLKQKSLLIESDQDFLAQLQRIAPASLAGFCVWTAQHNPTVWVKWHWYFDEELKQFVVPLHGVTSSVTIISPAGVAQPASALARYALRRIRRRHDWQPWVQLHEARRSPRAASAGQRGAGPPTRLGAAQPPPTALDGAIPPGSQAEFTEEEIAIIRMMDRGDRRKQIASELHLSTPTVDRRLASIRKRLSIGRNSLIGEAARWRGLI